MSTSFYGGYRIVTFKLFNGWWWRCPPYETMHSSKLHESEADALHDAQLMIDLITLTET